MGADLILNTIIIEDGKTAADLRDQLLTEVQNLKEKELKDLNEFWNIYESQDFCEAKDDWREKLRTIINNCIDSLSARDVSWIEHKGDRIYITGGMSWGDDPTDSFRNFELFNNVRMFLVGDE